MTRLTYAFSKKWDKKWDNRKAVLALHFAHYKFCRVHGSLRITPAMAAGITDRVWAMGRLREMTEQEQKPLYADLHFTMLDAIKKYEAATSWSVVDLRLVAKRGVSELKIVVLPNPPSPR